MNAKDMLDGLDAIYENHNTQEAERYLQKFQKKAEAEDDKELLISVLNELNGLYRCLGKYDTALCVGEKLLKLLEELPGKHSVEYATALGNVATVLREMGDYEKAIEMYAQESNILEGKDVDLYILASMHNNLGNAYLKGGYYDEAVDELKKALELDAKMDDSENEQAITLSAIANAHMMQKNYDKAEESLKEAITLFRRASYESPHYASALTAEGQLYYIKGNYEAALTLFREGLKKIYKAFGKNQNYVMICQLCADACIKLGHASEAKRYQQMIKEL